MIWDEPTVHRSDPVAAHRSRTAREHARRRAAAAQSDAPPPPPPAAPPQRRARSGAAGSAAAPEERAYLQLKLVRLAASRFDGRAFVASLPLLHPGVRRERCATVLAIARRARAAHRFFSFRRACGRATMTMTMRAPLG